jgi:branched-chain amino acid transport system ATP-binding protein
MSLEISNLNAGYQNIQVLFNINATIPKQKITVIVGPNGSGKSTFVKTIMGLTNVYSGEILFNTSNVTGLAPHIMTQRGIAYLPQVNNIFADLKVRENLRMSSYILSNDETQVRTSDALENFPILQKYLNQRAGNLSGGQRQMLAMAMAMIRQPQIMLFDEPTGSLAPKLAFEVLDKIVELREQYGLTIVLVEQNARRALERGDKALLLVSGQVMHEGSSRALLDHEDLGQLYLGIKQT